jgi:hypothetical protein
MFVAVTALVLAASGTAVATSHLVIGDKLIKRGSLSGNRLRNHTITGTQVNLNNLGTVPNANNADHATNADNAKNATNATNASIAGIASSAINAGNLGGQPPSRYLTTGNQVGTNGIVKAAGTAGGNQVTLFTFGPFTITMTCTTTGSGTTLEVDASSSEPNSVLNDNLVAMANTSTNVGPGVGPTTSFSENDNVNDDFEAPSGAHGIVTGATGVNSLGTDCWANFIGAH